MAASLRLTRAGKKETLPAVPFAPRVKLHIFFLFPFSRPLLPFSPLSTCLQNSEYVEAPPSPDSAPLQASGSSPVGESETTAPATPSAPVTPGAVAAPSSASASPFRPPVPLFDEDYEDDAPVPLSDEDDTPVPLSDEDYEDDAGQQEPVVVAEATAAATMATTAASPRRPPVPLFHEDYVDDPGQQESVAVAEATAAAEATMATTAARVAAAAAMTAGAVVTTPPKAFRRQRQGVRRRHSTGSAEEYLEMGKNARNRRRRRRRSELERDANEVRGLCEWPSLFLPVLFASRCTPSRIVPSFT